MNVINVDETDTTLNAILLAILLVISATAAMYFCKHFKLGRLDEEDYSEMPQLVPNFQIGPDGKEVIQFAPDGYFAAGCRTYTDCKHPHASGREYKKHSADDRQVSQ